MNYRYFCSNRHIQQIRNFIHSYDNNFNCERLASMSDSECFDVLEHGFGLIPLIEFKNQIYHNEIKKIYLIDSKGNIVVTLDSDK